MKTTILPTISLSLTSAATALMLLTSACDQGGADLLVDREGVECSPEGDREPTEAQTLAYSKEIVVSDGHNEVTLLVASEDEDLIKHYNDETFEIVPVFERPELPESEDGGDHDEALDPAHDFSHSVLIEERSVSLQDGAIGYELHEVGSEFRHAIQSCSDPTTYTSTADFVRVNVTSAPCTEARISTKEWFWIWYIQRAHVLATCNGSPTFYGGRRHSDRVKLEICPGSQYRMAFYR